MEVDISNTGTLIILGYTYFDYHVYIIVSNQGTEPLLPGYIDCWQPAKVGHFC